VKVDGEGIVAEWSRDNIPKLPTIIKSHPLSKLERYLTSKQVETYTEKYLTDIGRG
jgi:hypothetical protein